MHPGFSILPFHFHFSLIFLKVASTLTRFISRPGTLHAFLIVEKTLLQERGQFDSDAFLPEWMERASQSESDADAFQSAVDIFRYNNGGEPIINKPKTIRDTKNVLQVTTRTLQSEHTAIPSQSFLLVMIEDITPALVELLGSIYSIDPLFFEDHIRDPWIRKDPMLMFSAKRRGWFRIKHVRRVNYSDNARYEARKLYNVNRRGELFHWRNIPRSGDETVLVETWTRIWIGKNLQSPSTTVAVVLLDYLEHVDGSSASRTHDSIFNRSDTGDLPDESRSRHSWYDTILHHTTHCSWFIVSQKSFHLDLISIVCPVLYAICGEWLQICESVKAEIKREECFYPNPDPVRQENRIIEDPEAMGKWRDAIESWRDGH